MTEGARNLRAYGSGPAGDFNTPVRVDKGYDVMLRFVHAGLAGLSQHDGPLTIELTRRAPMARP